MTTFQTHASVQQLRKFVRARKRCDFWKSDSDQAALEKRFKSGIILSVFFILSLFQNWRHGFSFDTWMDVDLLSGAVTVIFLLYLSVSTYRFWSLLQLLDRHGVESLAALELQLSYAQQDSTGNSLSRPDLKHE